MSPPSAERGCPFCEIAAGAPAHIVYVVPRREGDGLFRAGMVWIRRRYAEGEAERFAARLREAIAAT